MAATPPRPGGWTVVQGKNKAAKASKKHPSPPQPSIVNLVPVMKVEVHRQRRGRMFGVYEENVSKSARGERVLSDYTSLVMRRYTGITLGFRSQGVEQFV